MIHVHGKKSRNDLQFCHVEHKNINSYTVVSRMSVISRSTYEVLGRPFSIEIYPLVGKFLVTKKYFSGAVFKEGLS